MKWTLCFGLVLLGTAFAAIAADDPLDQFIIEEAGQDSSGRGYVVEHQRLEKELLERRKEALKSDFRIKIRVAAKSDLDDFDSQIEADPSFGKEKIDPRLRIGNRVRENRKEEFEPFHPQSLREYLLQQAEETRAKLVPKRFSFARFNPEVPRNPSGTNAQTSVSNSFNDEIEEESSQMLQEVYRSKRYKVRTHPGARMIRP